MVVDIRKTPRSRANPKFNIDALPDVLSVRQIDYSRIEEVAGRTAKSRTAPPWVDGFWTNRSFHNYADYGDAHVTVIIRDRASYSPDPFQNRPVSAELKNPPIAKRLVWRRLLRSPTLPRIRRVRR